MTQDEEKRRKRHRLLNIGLRAVSVGREMRRGLALAAPVAATMLGAGTAIACPNCPTARLVRAQICDTRFGTNLVLTLAPLVILLGFALLMRRLGRSRRRMS